MSEISTVSVRILDKEFQVSCPPEEVEALTASARYLDQQMASIRSGGKVVGLDRIAVMAALNITHELLSSQNRVDIIEGASNDKMTELTHRLDMALAEHRQLQL